MVSLLNLYKIILLPLFLFDHIKATDFGVHPYFKNDLLLNDEHKELTNYPKYHFEYGVKDTDTGDIKEQSEIRDGDLVKGEYSLVEPDGTIRKVQYHDDGKSGFNVIVTRSGQAVHPPTKLKIPVASRHSSGYLRR